MATDRYTHRVTSVAPSGGRSWDRVGVLVLTLQSVRHQHTRGVPGAKWASLDMPLKVLQQPSKLLNVKFAGGGQGGFPERPWRTRHEAVPSPPRNARAALFFYVPTLTMLAVTVSGLCEISSLSIGCAISTMPAC
jgi:hypothetical protein